MTMTLISDPRADAHLRSTMSDEITPAEFQAFLDAITRHVSYGFWGVQSDAETLKTLKEFSEKHPDVSQGMAEGAAAAILAREAEREGRN
jgi:hypothetical protein